MSDGWRSRHGDEDGSTLILMPAAVLIVLMLASIAIDSAIIFRAERATQDVASGLANDAASALDLGQFYGSAGEPLLVIDDGRVRKIIDAVLASRGDDQLRITCEPNYPAAAVPTVEISCDGSTETILRPVFGLADRVKIRVSATATLIDG